MNLVAVVSILAFLFGAYLLFLSITVIRGNFSIAVNRRAGQVFFFAGFGALTWAVGQVIAGSANPDQLPDLWGQLHYLWQFFFPCLLLFALTFPVDRLALLGRNKMTRWIWLIFVPVILHVLILVFFTDVRSVLSLLNSGTFQEGPFSAALKPIADLGMKTAVILKLVADSHLLIFGVVNLLLLGATWYSFELAKGSVLNPRLVAQTSLLLWGVRGLAVIYFAAFLIAHLPPATDNQWADLLLIAMTGFGLVIVTIAVINRQFLNLQLAFRQSLIYTLVSGILVALYVLVALRCRDFCAPVLGEQAELVSWMLIAVLIVFFQPISGWTDSLLRSMFMRTQADHRSIIEQFSRSIISQFELGQLRRAVDETLKTALLVDRVYLCSYDDFLTEYVITEGDISEPLFVIDRQDLMLRGINQLDNPTGMSTLDTYRTDSLLAAFLTECEIRMIVPMKDGERLVGFLALTAKAAGYRYTPDDMNLLGVLANQMVTALTNARLYTDSLERIRLQEEVSMARQIQLDLLPRTPPVVPGLTIAADSVPSRTVGGDFFDFMFVEAQDRLVLMIADASGKGMPAALMVAQIQAMIRTEVRNGNDISSIIANVNRELAATTSPEKFVTLFMADYRPQNREMYYSNAGHNYPVLIRADRTMELLIDGGPIVGAFPEFTFTSVKTSFAEGDLLFIFTDGLSEAMNEKGIEFGEERLRALLLEHHLLSAEELVRLVQERVAEHDPTDPPQDDSTLIVVRGTRPR